MSLAARIRRKCSARNNLRRGPHSININGNVPPWLSYFSISATLLQMRSQRVIKKFQGPSQCLYLYVVEIVDGRCYTRLHDPLG